VLVDDVQPEMARAVGRSKWDAPEIDGSVIIHEADGIKPGDMVSVTVTDSDEYDLFGVPAAVAEQAA
jgi:ribosomal protein S12 methylthiotransferase